MAIVEGGESLTRMYVDNVARNLVPFDIARPVINEWPTGDITLGWDTKNEEVYAPGAACGAAIGALSTFTAAGRASPNAWREPAIGIFPRTVTFGGCIGELQHPTTDHAQAGPMYLVANYCDPNQELFRSATIPHSELSSVSKRSTSKGSVSEMIRSTNELYYRDSAATIQQLGRRALGVAIDRDYGLRPSDEEYFRIGVRYAIVERLNRDGLMPGKNSTISRVMYGQFVWACELLRPRLADGQSLVSILPPVCQSTYIYATEQLGAGLVSVADAGGRQFHLGNLPRLKRTAEDIKAISQSARPRQRHPVKRAPALPQQPNLGPVECNFDSTAVERLIHDPQLRGTAILTAARTAALRALADCRERAATEAAHRARLRTARETLRNRVYREHPYVRPDIIAALKEGSDEVAEIIGSPTTAAERLQAYTDTKRIANAIEWLTAYGALSMGDAAQQRAAREAIAQVRPQLMAALLNVVPSIVIPSVYDLPNLGTYNLTPALIHHATQEGTPPDRLSDPSLSIYIPAALAVIDNANSMFSFVPKSDNLVQAIARQGMPADPSMVQAVKHMNGLLTEEAKSHFWPQERRPDIPAGAPGGNDDLFIACRLAELVGHRFEDPRIHNMIALRIGPVLRRYKADWVNSQPFPERVRELFNFYNNRYNELAPPRRWLRRS